MRRVPVVRQATLRLFTRYVQGYVSDDLHRRLDVQFKRTFRVDLGRSSVVAPSFMREEPEQILVDLGTDLVFEVRVDRLDIFEGAVVIV